jgi:hypothetical protein
LADRAISPGRACRQKKPPEGGFHGQPEKTAKNEIGSGVAKMATPRFSPELCADSQSKQRREHFSPPVLSALHSFEYSRRPTMPKWINLLFLSFFTAVAGEAFFFTFIDPKLLYLFGEPVYWSPMVVYSLGFFMFWALTGLTAALVALMLKPGAEVNREGTHRPHVA